MRAVVFSRLLWVCLCAIVFFAACKKTPGGTTNVLVNNAMITTNDLMVSWSGLSMTSTALAQGKTSGTAAAPYVSLFAGTNQLIMKSGSTVLLEKNIYGAPGGHFSMIVYDNSQTATTPGVLMLTDNLTAVDSVNHANIRFIYCAPDTLVLDFILVNSTDTLGFGQRSFIGPSPNPASFQAFTRVKGGTYKPVAFVTGKAFISTAIFSADSITLGPKGIYSLVYSGKIGSTGADSLKLAVIQHPSN